MSLNVHQRIKRAAINGTGLRLSAQDTWLLYFGDSAVAQVADTSDGWSGGPRDTCGTYEQQTVSGGKPLDGVPEAQK